MDGPISSANKSSDTAVEWASRDASSSKMSLKPSQPAIPEESDTQEKQDGQPPAIDERNERTRITGKYPF